MPFYPFNTAIPDTNNDPGDDQPDMKNNNISLNGLLSEDHYSFNDINGGYHKFGTFVAQGGATQPFAGTSGVMFGKIVNGDTWPHWKNSSGTAIPIITGRPKNSSNGYTYLPGNILMQWGTVVPNANASTTVNYITNNINFNSDTYAVFIQPFSVSNLTNNSNLTYVVQSKSATSFSFFLINTIPISEVLWVAIGDSAL